MTIKGTGLKRLNLKDCDFTSTFIIDNMKLKSLFIDTCHFARGISAKSIVCEQTARISGSSIAVKADFKSSNFDAGLCVSKQTSTGKSNTESCLWNSNFEACTFVDKTKSLKSSSVNFNDCEFLGSANFDKVLFDGVPKFHGANMHPETSFHTMKEVPDLANPNKDISEIYGHYRAAFRTLRQHMENNNHFADAFKFGRLEMISKQLRGPTSDVPMSEIFFTMLYGKLADYGQSITRPLWGLLTIFSLSLMMQALIFWVSNPKCFEVSKSCVFMQTEMLEAFERANTFAIPPITMLANRSIDSGQTYMLPWIGHFSSGVIMVLHGLISSLMIFLFLVAIKRRLQIK